MKWLLLFAFLAGFVSIPSVHSEELVLRNNLMLAQTGDYIVVSANKTLTLLLVHGRKEPILTIEEVAVPEIKKPSNMDWKSWIQNGAPNHCSWVMYDIDLKTGQMLRYYSFSKKNWFDIPEADNFLSKLLNLKFAKIPDAARKRIGPPKVRSGPDLRAVWQPKMIVGGKAIEGVSFEAWKTKWPRDNSDLSGRNIEVYLPADSKQYPAYFPYWLQISGMVGNAKIRIIDSGNKLQSPKAYPTK